MEELWKIESSGPVRNVVVSMQKLAASCRMLGASPLAVQVCQSLEAGEFFSSWRCRNKDIHLNSSTNFDQIQ